MALAIDVAVQVATAGLYLLLALALGRRTTTPSARAALNLFRVWWASLAASTLVQPALVLLHMAGLLPVWLYLTVQEANVMLLALALWALLGYLLYAYRGSKRGWGLLAGAYVAFALALVALLHSAGTPEALVLGQRGVERVPALGLGPGATLAVFAMLLVPQLAATVAYLRLYGKAQGATQRYRIALVGSAILAWFGTTLVGALLQSQHAAWVLAVRGLGLAAALLVLLAYFPPRALRRRLGVHRLGQEDGPPAGG